MCSFDSHQLISDPIKTQIRHCSTVKVSQIRLCTARGAALFILPITPDIPAPVAMAWGQGLRKQRAGADSGRMPGLKKGGTLCATGPIGQPVQGVNVDKLELYGPR